MQWFLRTPRGVEEPPYHEPELYFYQGEFIRKVAAPDFLRMALA
jgi:hypothetical protein